MANPIRVLIVDDDPLVRVGLSMLLGGDPELELVGEAGDGAAAVDAALALRPDVVLMDLRMPGLDGLAATRTLRSTGQGPAVLVLTTFDTDQHILAALRSGASGFVLKDTPPAQLIAAVKRVAAGEPAVSPTVLERLIRHVASRDPASPASDPAPPGAPAGRRPAPVAAAGALAALAALTDRERQVAEAVADGKTNAEISRELFVEVATVKAYVSRILAKLECANRVQIAVLVLQSRH